MDRDASPQVIAAKVLELLNQARAQVEAPPLQLDAALTQLAQGHVDDMRNQQYLAHASPTRGSPADRAAAAHLPLAWTGENIALASTAREIHEGLVASPGHRMNMLDPHHNRVGIGVARSQGRSLLVSVEFGYALPPLATLQADSLAILQAAREGLPPLVLQPAWCEGLAPVLQQWFQPGAPDAAFLTRQTALLEAQKLEPPLPGSFRLQLVELSDLPKAAVVRPQTRAMRNVAMAFAIGSAGGKGAPRAWALLLWAPELPQKQPP